ncbi:ABC transporter substrate-binding protein [Natrinema ejinorense]|uniref:Thiamine pyrimidine synthase n=1 Tax=Natrinema ejinorense TaxID=373386 RepID=A0A2A5QQI3_9EURY|nr:ABC transporter substrate-binding protein [Natrinema ejinorense]PCR89003.1 myristoyl transferase [Natrinema ejinorense]
MTSVTFQLNWEPNGFQAPYFLARRRGFYEDEGVTIQFVEGHGSPYAAKQAARGNADIGLAGASAVLATRSQGEDPIAIAAVTNRTPAAFYTLRDVFDEPLSDPAQLAGTTVAPSATKTRILAAQALERAGIRSEVDLKPVDPNTHHRVEHQLLEGTVDAAVGVVTNGVELEHEHGRQSDELPIGELLGVYGMMLVTNESFAAQNPTAVRAFLRATARGWAAATNDPDAAIDALISRNATLEQRRWIETRKLRAAVDGLQYHDGLTEAGWGAHRPQRWQRLSEYLQETTLLDGSIDPGEVWTNEYIDHDANVIEDYASLVGCGEGNPSRQ